MKVLVYENDDGSVAVVTPSAKWLARTMTERGIREDAALDLLAEKDIPATIRDTKGYHGKDASELPSYQFRDAWRLTPEGEIVHDLRTIRRIRRWRDNQKIQRRLDRISGITALQAKVDLLIAAKTEDLRGRTLEQLRDYVPTILNDPAVTASEDVPFDLLIEQSMPRDVLPMVEE